MTRFPILRLAATVLAIGLLTAPALRAQRPQNVLDTAIAVRSGAALMLDNVAGDITIRVAERSEIRVHAEYESSRIEVTASGNRVSVRTFPARHRGEVIYSVTVPAGTALEVNGVSSDIEVTGVCGATRLQTVSGNVTATCLVGDAELQSVSGDVRATDVRGDLEVNSTSGDVTVRNARGDVSGRSVSGNLEFLQVEGQAASGSSVGGDITFVGRIADNGRYAFESHSGDVTLRVPGTPNASVEVSTFSGEFDSDFEVQLPPGNRVSNREWQFRLGSGSARIRLQSFSGSLSLRRTAGGTTNREE